MNIILGSASKWRQEILREEGLAFSIMTADIDEKAIRDPDPEVLTMKLAHAKADAILPKVSEPALLITSDQVTVCGQDILEKPESPEEARAMLSRYGHEAPRTVTAVVVTNTKTAQRFEGIDVVEIVFSPIAPEAMEVMVADPDTYTCSGGIRIKSPTLKPFIRVVGDITSVSGLPMELTMRLLAEAAA